TEGSRPQLVEVTSRLKLIAPRLLLQSSSTVAVSALSRNKPGLPKHYGPMVVVRALAVAQESTLQPSCLSAMLFKSASVFRKNVFIHVKNIQFTPTDTTNSPYTHACGSTAVKTQIPKPMKIVMRPLT
ncbi:MAG: hypothetical protein ACK6EB_45795, partial [Planctomyces sp.]